MKIENIIKSKLWFLIGALIFLIGALRLYIREEGAETIIYFIAGFLFLIGFIGQVLFNKTQK